MKLQAKSTPQRNKTAQIDHIHAVHETTFYLFIVNQTKILIYTFKTSFHKHMSKQRCNQHFYLFKN